MKIAILEDCSCIHAIGYLAYLHGHETLVIRADRYIGQEITTGEPSTFSLLEYPGTDTEKQTELSKHYLCGNATVIRDKILAFKPDLVLLDHFLDINATGDWFADELRMALPHVGIISISSVCVGYADSSISGKDSMNVNGSGYKNFLRFFTQQHDQRM